MSYYPIIKKCITCDNGVTKKSRTGRCKSCSNSINARKMSPEVRRRVNKNLRLGIKGSANNNWKGEEAGYVAKHQWVRREMGNASEGVCCACGNEKSLNNQWANIDHTYTRDKEKWVILCASCHYHHDRK